MTRQDCAAIAAYLTALSREYDAYSDLRDALKEGHDEAVDAAEAALCVASEATEHAFQSLPETLRDYLEEQSMPAYPEGPAPMPPGMDVDMWAEMAPDERWQFVFDHHPDIIPSAIAEIHH